MNNMQTLIEFRCRGYRFALPLACVRRVVRGAQPVPLPGAPDIILGLLNVGGEIVTIINFHQRAGLAFSGIDLSHQLLLLEMRGLCVGFPVDYVAGVVSREIPDAPPVPAHLAGADFVQAVVTLEDGLCLICGPEKFLLDKETAWISEAVESVRHANS